MHFSKRGHAHKDGVRLAFSSHLRDPRPLAYGAAGPVARYNLAKMTGGTAMAGLELSYVYGASDRPLIGKTVGQFFDEASTKCPSHLRGVAPGGRQARRRAFDARS